MAVCAVCQASCRGRCAKCGAPLCVHHRPTSSRAKCAICKRLGTSTVQAVRAIPPSHTVAQQSSSTSQSHALPLAILSLSDQLAWIAQRRAQLVKKQARERVYLDRRTARGTHTPTDEAYESDSVLESELLEALDLLETMLKGNSPVSGPSGSHHTYAGDTSMLFPDPGLNAKIQP